MAQAASPELLFHQGNTLMEQGDCEGAIQAYRQALAIKPDSVSALSHLGNALKMQGDLQGAIAAHRQALSIKPGYLPVLYNLRFLQLLTGDYEQGWQGFQQGLELMAGEIVTYFHKQVPLQRWNGNNLAPGEEIILIDHMDIGDVFQFMRYVIHLNNSGTVASLLLKPEKIHKLRDLIQTSGVPLKIPDHKNQIECANFKWCPLLSLPGLLQITPNNPIINTPYIKTSPDRIEYWRQKLAAEEHPIIGINWQGSYEGAVAQQRIFRLECFKIIAAKTPVTFLALQKGGGAEQLATCSFRNRFVKCQDEISRIWDFVETAAMIANCHLVVTNDTMVAHLAAGMGKATWLLLNTLPDWRWGLSSETTFWYPSMRIFRQREWGNWTELMERVAVALRETLGNLAVA